MKKSIFTLLVALINVSAFAQDSALKQDFKKYFSKPRFKEVAYLTDVMVAEKGRCGLFRDPADGKIPHFIILHLADDLKSHSLVFSNVDSLVPKNSPHVYSWNPNSKPLTASQLTHLKLLKEINPLKFIELEKTMQNIVRNEAVGKQLLDAAFKRKLCE